MIHSSWNQLFAEEWRKPYYKALQEFLTLRRLNVDVYPQEDAVYRAFELTPLSAVRVVILGQDPYHQPGQAMGLSFSVQPHTLLPKSLNNMYKELYDDVKLTRLDGDLTHWATQGVLLLNTILTVEHGQPLSHSNKGWEVLTDRVIETLSAQSHRIIFVLWGKEAQQKESMIAATHVILKAPHPSPLSAYRGFFGSKPFSKINEILINDGLDPIDWS